MELVTNAAPFTDDDHRHPAFKDPLIKRWLELRALTWAAWRARQDAVGAAWDVAHQRFLEAAWQVETFRFWSFGWQAPPNACACGCGRRTPLSQSLKHRGRHVYRKYATARCNQLYNDRQRNTRYIRRVAIVPKEVAS